MTLYISPYRRLASLRDAMDRMFDETIAEAAPRERELTLAVDVLATDEGYVIKSFVPGLKAEDLSIEVINNTVAIRGEFKAAENGDKARYLASELPTGRFSRGITLPTTLDSAKAEASLTDGLLTLRIPKAEAHRPKAIQINRN
jgi:HSP20 family protein